MTEKSNFLVKKLWSKKIKTNWGKMALEISDLQSFEAAERRLDQLERRIFGETRKVGIKSDTCLVPKLASIAQEVGDGLGRRERIAPLFRKLNELENLLDPASNVQSGLTLESRAELILSEESKLKETNAMLDQVQDKKKVLDSESIKNVPDLESKLLDLTRIHLEQNAQGDQWSGDVLKLIEQYNDVIDSITKAFIEYDKIISAAETSK